MSRVFQSVRMAAAVVAIAIVGGFVFRSYSAAAEDAHVIPPPMVDLPAGQATSAVTVLAGGCFWGVQGVFQHVKGVTSAVSGYAGGEKRTAVYEIVSMGNTGHAESVQITYDPRQISYGRLLQLYFSVVHDPTELNRQGPDSGPQYRSTIFAASPEQANVARAYIVQLDRAHVFKKPVVTTIEQGRAFYTAEDHHQDFLTLNPTYPYIAINDIPKVEDLKRLFPQLYRAEPILVGKTRTQ